MNVKELKEFLKDIDDDVEIMAFQEKYDDVLGEYICLYDVTDEDLSLHDNKLFI